MNRASIVQPARRGTHSHSPLMPRSRTETAARGGSCCCSRCSIRCATAALLWLPAVTPRTSPTLAADA
eukprot:11932312-Alexandrium_andersonii.AAC.1